MGRNVGVQYTSDISSPIAFDLKGGIRTDLTNPTLIPLAKREFAYIIPQLLACLLLSFNRDIYIYNIILHARVGQYTNSRSDEVKNNLLFQNVIINELFARFNVQLVTFFNGLINTTLIKRNFILTYTIYIYISYFPQRFDSNQYQRRRDLSKLHIFVFFLFKIVTRRTKEKYGHEGCSCCCCCCHLSAILPGVRFTEMRGKKKRRRGEPGARIRRDR